MNLYNKKSNKKLFYFGFRNIEKDFEFAIISISDMN
jgi:hypothetical protein